ncbi:MAG: hypothetical protein EOP49_48735, partial [Sphingobacteriales bacterium]
MNYDETIDYLFTRLPMYSRIGASAYKTDLTNTIALCEYLGNPQEKLRCVHIAGTNGKGSTSHMLAAILQSAGYKTGLYTSPHLKDFRERIRINGKPISEEWVVAFVAKHKDLIEAVEPSFFEITVAMAFDYFAQRQVDILTEDIARLQRSLQDATNQYQGGIVDRTDPQRAKIALNNSRAQQKQYRDLVGAKVQNL